MKYVVSIEPQGNEDNEYATPCYLHFENIEIMMTFIESLLTFGDGISVHIEQVM